MKKVVVFEEAEVKGVIGTLGKVLESLAIVQVTGQVTQDDIIAMSHGVYLAIDKLGGEEV